MTKAEPGKKEKVPKNKRELLNELRKIVLDETGHASRQSDRYLALGLAYIINEICPEDRTTQRVLKVSRSDLD